jgi:hypothetical protein
VAALAAGPAAAADSTGFWVAFQGSTGALWTVDPAGVPTNTTLPMLAGTSPSLTFTAISVAGIGVVMVTPGLVVEWRVAGRRWCRIGVARSAAR